MIHVTKNKGITLHFRYHCLGGLVGRAFAPIEGRGFEGQFKD